MMFFLARMGDGENIQIGQFRMNLNLFGEAKSLCSQEQNNNLFVLIIHTFLNITSLFIHSNFEYLLFKK